MRKEKDGVLMGLAQRKAGQVSGRSVITASGQGRRRHLEPALEPASYVGHSSRFFTGGTFDLKGWV